MVLYSAIQQHGCPRILVSDSGGIFKATQAKRIYEALGIEKKQIEKRQSWQNLIESKSGARLDEPKQNHMLSFASILASYAFTEGFLSEVVFERLEAIASSAGIQQGVACLAESLPSQVASRAAP
jgi:hypothetical protein